MANFTVEGTKTKKLYVNKNGTKSLIRKLKVVKDGATTIPYALPEVTFSSSLLSNTTKKDVLMGDTYGDFPTLTANSNRVDFWFYPDVVAKNDSAKKYVDYPWCAYADANNLYSVNHSSGSTYGYNIDLLAEHWDKTGSTSSNYKSGGLSSTDTCTKTDNHTIQHVSTTKQIACTFLGEESAGSLVSNGLAMELFYSTGSKIDSKTLSTSVQTKGSWTVYPGMKIKLYARSKFITGSATPFIKINTVNNGNNLGTEYTYTVPNNITSISIVTNPRHNIGLSLNGEWWEVNVTVK